MKYVIPFMLSLGVLAAVVILLKDRQPSESAEVVVLLHGLGRSDTAMWPLAERLKNADFDVQRVGYSSLKTSPVDMIETVTEQVDRCCADESRVIHFVGHSLGGLLIRAYLENQRPKRLGNTVLIGTPNGGTEVADHFRDHPLVEHFLPVATQLGTDSDSLPKRLPSPDYPVGVIAGVVDSELGALVKEGPNDGMVSVESTAVENMQDFIQLEAGHSMMRYDEEVAKQVIHFLHTGRFQRNDEQEQ